VFIAYLFVEGLLLIAAGSRLPQRPFFLLVHVVMMAVIVLLARWPRLGLLADWYPVIYIPVVFKMLQTLVPAVHPRTYDEALLAWDLALFGRHPGEWFDAVASPFLTEVFRACWLSYFLMPLLIVVPLYLRKNRNGFNEAVLALLLGWLLSFLGYFAVPALGPGYFPDRIPAPACVNQVGVTQTVAQGLFALEGRMHDIFPSGHAIIALLALWLAWRNRLRGRFMLIPLVTGLLMGTVYLRYHYGVDVLAGAVIAGGVILVAPRWHRRVSTSSA
jgi:membrane-associated phospholipid phosphatase